VRRPRRPVWCCLLLLLVARARPWWADRAASGCMRWGHGWSWRLSRWVWVCVDFFMGVLGVGRVWAGTTRGEGKGVLALVKVGPPARSFNGGMGRDYNGTGLAGGGASVGLGETGLRGGSKLHVDMSATT